MHILVTQSINTEALSLLRQHGDVEVIERRMTLAELAEQLRNKHALVCSVTDTVDASIIAAAPELKIISNIAVGYNNIDIKAAGERGIAVTNTPHTLTASVVEFVFAHLLAWARRLREAENHVRTKQFTEWSLDLFLGTELHGKTLGIIGVGTIGQALVAPALGFGLRILYTNRRGPLPAYARNESVQPASLDEVLGNADFVVLLVPLTAETKHLITSRELGLMKPSAVLINMARGPIVREADLVEAIKNKVIAGACLDVYEFEPRVPEELLGLVNVVLTPHIGSATLEARRRMALLAAQNAIDVLTGKTCPNIVNSQYLRLV